MPNQFTTQLAWLTSAISAHESNECLDWPFTIFTDGYGRVQHLGKQVSAQRAAFYLVHGRYPEPCGRHTCDRPKCVNPSHIVEGTQQQNIQDMIDRKRFPKGTSYPNAKLTDELVRQMRSEYVPGSRKGLGTSGAIARRYGIDHKNCWNILNRRAWKHVDQ